MFDAMLDSEYFAALQKRVSSIEYSNAPLQYLYNKIFYADDVAEDIKKIICAQLNEQGFCVVNFGKTVSPDFLATWQESFLGKLMTNKNPKGLPYSRVAIKKGGVYFADSAKAQPLHNDEGYTVNVPEYISLFCQEQAAYGGINTLVLVDDFFKYFSEELSDKELLCNKSAMSVVSAHGEIAKPLFFYYDNHKIGISYSPIVKQIKLSNKLKKIFTLITEYMHQPDNQIRIKLEEGDLLILNNFRVLHGRTAFSEDSNRTMYRFWFSLRNISEGCHPAKFSSLINEKK